MFFLVFVLFLDCFFNMHLCAKLQPYRSNYFYTVDVEWLSVPLYSDGKTPNIFLN